MALKTLRLSPNGVKTLARQGNERDFDWIVGSTRFRSKWIYAEAASPKIAKLRATDSSITEYVVETPDPNNQFQTLLETSERFEVERDGPNSDFLLNLFRELENLDQYWSVRETFGRELIIARDEPIPPELLNKQASRSSAKFHYFVSGRGLEI
jgi:hypothetical protein